MLTIDNITCERGGVSIFQNFSFTLGERGLLVLRGRNGCGKTSLLKIISGMIPPADGCIYFDGENIKKDMDSYRKEILYLGHKNGLNSKLTVQENLDFWCEISGHAEMMNAAIIYFDIENVLEMPVYMLSQGWQRRIALTRLMLSSASLWLLDEPLANLDADVAEMVLKLIATKCDNGGMVIMSSHKENELEIGMEIDVSVFCKRI